MIIDTIYDLCLQSIGWYLQQGNVFLMTSMNNTNRTEHEKSRIQYLGSFPSLVTSYRHSASFTFFLYPSLPPICASAEEQVTLYRTSVCLSVCLSINFANGLRIVDGWGGRFISKTSCERTTKIEKLRIFRLCASDKPTPVP